MVDFPHPAARDWLIRWREVLAGAVVVLFGVWWWSVTFAFVQWLGIVVALIGVAIMWTAVQRLRFRQGGGGAGVVQIDERRLMYFGPLTGGMIDMDDLTRLILDPTGHPAHWLLTTQAGDILAVPVNAEGADALFDLFAVLPGIKTEQMLDLLARAPKERVTIWEKERRLLH